MGVPQNFDMQDADTPKGEYREVAEVPSSKAGMPWFLHRGGQNSLQLDEPVWELPRVEILTSPVTDEFTLKHLRWRGRPDGYRLPPEALTDDLDCAVTDYWLLMAWRSHSSWIPRRSKKVLTECLPEVPVTRLEAPDHSSSLAAVVPVESFGEDIVMCLNLQSAMLGYLKKTRQEKLTQQRFGIALLWELCCFLFWDGDSPTLQAL